MEMQKKFIKFWWSWAQSEWLPIRLNRKSMSIPSRQRAAKSSNWNERKRVDQICKWCFGSNLIRGVAQVCVACGLQRGKKTKSHLCLQRHTLPLPLCLSLSISLYLCLADKEKHLKTGKFQLVVGYSLFEFFSIFQINLKHVCFRRRLTSHKSWGWKCFVYRNDFVSFEGH